jgi:ABC-2 type transport system permease protein
LRAAWAVARNDLALLRAQPVAAIITVAVPINFLILFVLFAVGGGVVPVTVQAASRGPATRAFVQALRDSATFAVHPVATAAEAAAAIRHQDAVASIALPADPASGTVQVMIDNLNGDFADDIRRGLPLAVTLFQRVRLPLTWNEVDTYTRTIGFLAFLAVSIQTVALLIGGLLQGGLGVAREWESGTVKELLLAPVPGWSVVLGKLIAAFIGALAGAALVLVALLLLGVRPHAWAQFAGVLVLVLIVFVSLGVGVGSALRSRQTVFPLAFGLGLPLFFISGPFQPIAWGTAAAGAVARLFPVVYANAAFQQAAFGFWTLDTPVSAAWAILAGWTLLALAASLWLYRRATVAR